MNLTFKGFLRSYCRELTGLETDNLKKLLAAALDHASAAAEAVMVFAAIQGKSDYLARLAAGTRLEAAYQAVSLSVAQSQSVEAYLSSSAAPQRYQNVWTAYEARRNAIEADRRVIALMRERTLESLRGSNATAYQLCKQLGLNLGNTYAYLNGGDVTKVSRATARRIMEHAAEMA